ncbi:hypothetical protein SK128_010964, partial [Halocaridina rubra]
MLYLAQNPDKQSKMQEELDSILGNGNDPLTPDQMAKLSYTKAAVKETLRMSPVSLGVARSLRNDVVLSGYRIPKGFNVFALTKYAGMMEEFFPEPNEFLPERWIREHASGSLKPYSCVPFGFGPRMCIGRRFAEQEMYVILAR